MIGRPLEAWEKEYSGSARPWKGVPDYSFHLNEGEIALDVGCGNGKSVSSIKGDGEVIALDHSYNALFSCGRLFPKAQGVRGDALHLPFRSSTFDLVLCSHVLDHLLAGDRAIASGEISRLVRPGGLLFVNSFAVDDMRFGKGMEVEKDTFLRGNGIIYHYFREEEIKSLFASLTPIGHTERAIDKIYHGRDFRRVEVRMTFQRPKDEC